ncbi:hypothetical protein [Streptomyces cyaneofuscatus]|uniref:hypothetical protein n=1 Tax=Streptomyces cyaneofuscatus TaxID=66883 RepID=UPI0037D85217
MTFLNWLQFAATCMAVALGSLVLTKFLNAVLASGQQLPSRSEIRTYRPGALRALGQRYLLSDLRLSCRSFGVRFSISGRKLNSMASDGFWYQQIIPIVGSITAFLLPVGAFAVSTQVAAPFVRESYEAKFQVVGDRGPFYIAIALYVFAIMWWSLELRRVRAWIASVGHRRAFYECCRCVVVCLDVREGRSTIISVDRRVHQIGRALIRFSESEARKGGASRQNQLFEHAVRVKAALDDCAGRALKEGESALPDVVAMLMKILERLSAGRLLGLLDEHELPAFVPPSAEELEGEADKGDRRIVLWGAAAAAVVAGVMISLGVPAGAVVPAALIFLMGPAVLWGSKKIGNPRELMDSMRQGVAQPQEPQQSVVVNGAPSSAPDGNLPPARAPIP